MIFRLDEGTGKADLTGYMCHDISPTDKGAISHLLPFKQKRVARVSSSSATIGRS